MDGMDETTKRNIRRAVYNLRATQEVEVMGMRGLYLSLPAGLRERFKADIVALVGVHERMRCYNIKIKLPYDFDEERSGAPEPKGIQDAIVLWEQSEGYIPDDEPTPGA